MTKNNTAKAFVTFGALLVVAVAAFAGTTMGYKFSEGYSQQYKVKFSQEMDFGGFARSEIIDMEVTESCTGVDGDKYKMTMTFNKIESSMLMMGQMKDSPLGEAMLEKTVSYIVDANGEVDGVEALDYIDGWDTHKKTIAGIIEGWYLYLPDEDVDVGGEWAEAKLDTNQTGMIIDSNAAYKYKENKEQDGVDCAVIEGKSSLKFGGNVDTPMGSMAVEGKGESKVKFYFAVQTGAVIKMKLSGENQLDMTQDNGNVLETTINQSMERETIK